MVAVVRVHKLGGPEVLTFEEIDVAAPGAGQIRIKQHASGVNFIDTYFREGAYPSPVGLPFVAGNEGAGEVIEVGGDRAVVQECVVDDQVVVRRDSGAVVNDAVASHNVRGELKRVGGVWRVSEARLIQRWEGVAGCASGQ